MNEMPKILVPEDGPFKLDLGCGKGKKEGFIGIDIVKTEDVDYILDLTTTNWPIPDSSVDEIYCCHVFEHLEGPQRIPFMDECWRIMKVGAQMQVIVPYWNSMAAIQDPTHKWPPVCERSFLYFNKGFRKLNDLGHYLGKADFDFGVGYTLDSDTGARVREVQEYRVKYYCNAVSDLFITLTKRAEDAE
jgi:ubiquinone/menaquinone biosynthesis C-methylase UbiE